MAFACTISSLPEYQCEVSLISGQYQLYYAVKQVEQGDTPVAEVSFRAEVQNEGWMGLGFSPQGIMGGSTAVIASSMLEPQVHDLNGYSVLQVVPVDDPDFSNLEYFVDSDSQTNVLTFNAIVPDIFSFNNGLAEVGMVAAFHPDNPQLAFHGSSNSEAFALVLELPQEPPPPEITLCEVTGKEYSIPCAFNVLDGGPLVNVADVVYLANLIVEGPSSPPLPNEVATPLCEATSNSNIQLSCNFDFDKTDGDNEINIKDLQALIAAILDNCWALLGSNSPDWPECNL
mmetsp:Transcript_7130/g.26227  ORF Transcript_7130/g.26227 Transcript_7130/m.26227 type:complete len:287 (-) Transcript_7130:140-1000(-)